MPYGSNTFDNNIYVSGSFHYKREMEREDSDRHYEPLEIDVSDSKYGFVFCNQTQGNSCLQNRASLSDGTTVDSSCERVSTSSFGSNSMPSSSPSIYPSKMRFRSKGKPENVCQLMALIEQKTSIGNPIFQEQECVGMKDVQKARSVSVAGCDFRHQKLSATPLSLKRYSSQLRSPRFFEMKSNIKQQQVAPYTPPPMLSPMRRGSGLYWNVSTHFEENATNRTTKNDDDFRKVKLDGFEDDMDFEIERKRGRHDKPSTSQFIESSAANTEMPARKNGFCYTSPTMEAKLLRLQALRKDSENSWPLQSGASASTVDRKLSVPVSGEITRKLSSASEFDDDYCVPQETDVIPHINCGRDYQAKVKKWADRAIADEERDAIPDRDEAVFSCHIIDHIEDSAVEAYELLACSQAVPRPGRNRELALHLLMENKGNIQEAVLDLMRLDTLDWSQYPIIYNSVYTDSDRWSPEEINFFQDAIYKSEKDFHQVAADLGKSVKQCVEFYYLWKKACPDDYRKLRNLRHKRQLLEMQQKIELAESYNARTNTQIAKSCELSGSEVDSEHPDYGHDIELDKVSDEAVSNELHRSELNVRSPLTGRKYSAVRFTDPSSINTLSAHSTPVIVSPSSHARMPNLQTHRQPPKKGAQPSADGFFHCRLCDKFFEKVKSLNAHMKSHAMKARAEAEAQSQLKTQPYNNAISNNNVDKSVPQNGTTNTIQQHHSTLQQNTNNQGAGIQGNLNANVNGREQATAFGPILSKTGPIPQDIFAQTSLTQDQFGTNNLMSSQLGQVGLGAHSALNQSALTAASMLSHLPQAQAIQFLTSLQNPGITH